MTKKTAITRTEIDQLIANRWSPNAFDPDRAIEVDKIAALIEAARWAPSCYNAQPWRFIVCDKQSNKVAWQFAVSCLVPQNQLWAKNAPLLILACANEMFSHNGKANRWAQYDSGAAGENICLQATSMGLFAHQMGGFDVDRAHEVFKIPQQITPMAMIAVGYYGNTSSVESKFIEGDKATRERKAAENNFFYGDFETPYVL